MRSFYSNLHEKLLRYSVIGRSPFTAVTNTWFENRFILLCGTSILAF